MARKAEKSLAVKNAARLNFTLYITLGVHFWYLLLRVLVFKSSFTRNSLILYVLFSIPSLAIEFWFEKIARPSYIPGPSGAPELKKSGEDLESKGLTEFLWDILYWTWICTILAGIVGDYAWWLYVVVPAYSVYLAYTTFIGARQGMAGFAGAGSNEVASGAQSKRQQKIEKRGGQKTVYR